MRDNVKLEHNSAPYRGKGALDRIAAAAACLTLAPLAVLIATAITLEDGGSPLFRQERVGRDRRSFVVYKFRTMSQGKVTRVGALLRRAGIDEIPQFINVLRGDMSVVGPRPLAVSDVERLGWSAPEYDWRFGTPPGITGLSQLLSGQGVRLSRRLDRLYLRRQGVFLDARLIALSAIANLLGKRRAREWLDPTR